MNPGEVCGFWLLWCPGERKTSETNALVLFKERGAVFGFCLAKVENRGARKERVPGNKMFCFRCLFGLEKHEEGYQVQLYYGTRTKLDSLPCLIGKATERNPSLILVWYQNQVGLVAFFEWKSNRKEAQVQLYFGTRTKLDSLHFLIGKTLERSPSPTLFWHQKEIALGPLFSSISKPKKHRGQLYAGTKEKLDEVV